MVALRLVIPPLYDTHLDGKFRCHATLGYPTNALHPSPCVPTHSKDTQLGSM